jgi:hypothetical protein
MKEKYFEFIAECCKLLGKPGEYGVLLVEDKSWFAAFDDGMTAEDAVKEFKETYPNGYPKELEDKYL